MAGSPATTGDTHQLHANPRRQWPAAAVDAPASHPG